ncbi:MAG: NAD(+)/NADH kinase [Persicimonas sp.]
MGQKPSDNGYRVLVAHKKSAYDKYVLEEHDESIAELVSQGHISVRSLESSHKAHTQSLTKICEHLSSQGIDFDRLYRGEVTDTEGYDLAITVGGDGTVLDLSHRITDTPLLAINSDPQSSIGYFCAGTAAAFPDLLERTLEERWEPFHLRRFRTRINDETISVPVLNDVLITHSNPAAVSHYLLTIDANEPEEQKSSGIWISTPAGSTAAIRSAGGYVMPLDSRTLQYLVREPYPLRSTAYHFLKGIRPLDEHFEVISKMHDGRVFVDGPHLSYPFSIGDVVRIDANAPELTIYGLDERRRTAE